MKKLMLVFLLSLIFMCTKPPNYVWTYSRTDMLEEVKYLESTSHVIVDTEQVGKFYKIYYKDKKK